MEDECTVVDTGILKADSGPSHFGGVVGAGSTRAAPQPAFVTGQAILEWIS